MTGTPMTAIVAQRFDFGLSHEDVRHLERLSDPDVLRQLGKNTTGIAHDARENVVAYLEAWADVLEAKRARSASASATEDRQDATHGMDAEIPVAAE